MKRERSRNQSAASGSPNENINWSPTESDTDSDTENVDVLGSRLPSSLPPSSPVIEDSSVGNRFAVKQSQNSQRTTRSVQRAMANLNSFDDRLAPFPASELSSVMSGLSRMPWTIYPAQLCTCLTAALPILQWRQSLDSTTAGQDQEWESSPVHQQMRVLFQEAVPGLLSKALDDGALWKWNANTRGYTFEAFVAFMDCLVARAPCILHPAVAAAGSSAVRLPPSLAEMSDARADMIAMLPVLTTGWDARSQFHEKHSREPYLPPGVLPLPDSQLQFASNNPHSRASRPSAQSDILPPRTLTRSQSALLPAPPGPFPWLTYFLNYFGHTKAGNGYQVMAKVLLLACGNHQQQHELPPSLLEALLSPLALVAPVLLPSTAAMFVEVREGTAQHMRLGNIATLCVHDYCNILFPFL